MKIKRSGFIYLCGAVAALALTPAMLQATPYASGITNNAGTIQFILNESANDVSVIFDNGLATNDLGALAAGKNSFSLGGVHTNYSIVVTKVGSGSVSQIGADSTNNAFYGPRGVTVNRNPKDYYFGRIYVVNASGGLAIAGKATGRGLYMLNADTSDAVGQATNAILGGMTLGSSTTYSPNKIFVGPDDMVYVGDATGQYTGTHGGASVWMLNPNCSNAIPVLNWTNTPNYFGGCISTPYVKGSLASGNLMLYCTEWLYPTNSTYPNYNSIFGYSVGGSLPCITTPTFNTPGIGGPTLVGFPGINSDVYIAPDGKIYTTQYRVAATGGVAGGAVSLWVFSADGTTNIWDSSTAGGGTDPFTGTYGVAVSPDDLYVATICYTSGNFLVAKLTNGLPDLSTLVTNVVSLGTSTARAIAFDAADNVYAISGGVDRMRAYTLGLTTTATTYNDITGTNGTFQLTLPATSVSVVAVTNQASQSGPTPGLFTITRASTNSSVLSLPLSVTFVLGGTATNGTYTTVPAGLIVGTNTITLAAGQVSTNITIVPVNDGLSRPTTTVVLSLKGGGGYSTTTPSSDTVYIQNVGPQLLFVSSAVVPTMYNAFSNDYAAFIITRWGNTNAAAYSVSAYTTGGTAISGVDYTAPGSVTINPGALTVTNFISPLMNGQLPVDSTTNPFVGNKTVIISVASGSGYSAATNTATLTILDSATPTATYLYYNPLTDPNDATNWGVTSANNNMQTNAIDDTIEFGYSLVNDPDGVGPIGLPPSGATSALRVTVNKTAAQLFGAAGGVNLYPTNLFLSGNYAVRFNMNIIEGDNSSYTTEGAMFGIDHKGYATNWWTGSALLSGWGAGNVESWESDGVWYWLSADGGAAAGDYLEYTGVGGVLPNTGWTQLAAVSRTTLGGVFKTNVFTTTGGPGLVANGSPYNNYNDNSWSDVELKQFKGIVTLTINKTQILAYTNTTSFTNGTIMLGYEDPFSSVGTFESCVYYSNIRVVPVGPPYITQTAVNNANGTVVLNFSTMDADLSAASFTVQSITNALSSAWVNVAGATVSSLGGGAFQAVVPKSGTMQYYRINANEN